MSHVELKVGNTLITIRDEVEPIKKTSARKLAERFIEVEGFKVGDRVTVGGMSGTIICITTTDMFGVQFDDEQFHGHRCGGVKLKAGSPSSKANCWWVKAKSMSKGTV